MTEQSPTGIFTLDSPSGRLAQYLNIHIHNPQFQLSSRSFEKALDILASAMTIRSEQSIRSLETYLYIIEESITFLLQIRLALAISRQPAMGDMAKDVHMLFFPFMAQGHMLPMVDMAKLFAARGARVTVLTTPANAAAILPSTASFPSLRLHIIPFPSAAAGLPEGCENRSSLPSEDLRPNFFRAVTMLSLPFDAVLQELNPDCAVTDMFMPWTCHVAAERNIPRLVFHGMNFFAQCAGDAFEKYHPLDALPPEAESFVLPNLPRCIEMLRTQALDIRKLYGTPMASIAETFKEVWEVEPKNYGVVVNSFYELEPEFADYYRDVMGRKAWHVGPVSLCNQELADNSARAGEAFIAEECIKWLDGKPPGSVVYACFGSGSLFSEAQLCEMALGLEASGHPFIWVVRNAGDGWIPDGYDDRIKGRGFVIRGWSPQLLILNHAAAGGFVTHCGWNSSLEGISAGMPMVTWPLYADQFYNERLLVDVLNIGVAVGSKVYAFTAEERPVVEAAAVEKAVRRVMGDGEEAEKRRKRVRKLREMARRAFEKGGSSYDDMGKLMQELVDRRKKGDE